MSRMVDHTQDEDVVHPHHIEHAIRKAPKIGPTDLLVKDREARGMCTDLGEGSIQLVPKGKIQPGPLPGVPLLCGQEILLGRRAEAGSNHRVWGQISALMSSQSRPSSEAELARRSSRSSRCHGGSGMESASSRLDQIASAISSLSSAGNSITCRWISSLVMGGVYRIQRRFGTCHPAGPVCGRFGGIVTPWSAVSPFQSKARASTTSLARWPRW